MSKENLEQFMKQVVESEDLQASAELSDAELKGVSGGLRQPDSLASSNRDLSKFGIVFDKSGTALTRFAAEYGPHDRQVLQSLLTDVRLPVQDERHRTRYDPCSR